MIILYFYINSRGREKFTYKVGYSLYICVVCGGDKRGRTQLLALTRYISDASCTSDVDKLYVMSEYVFILGGIGECDKRR
jgi:hypothetical protein